MESCIHYWLLGSTNYSRCIKCGEERQFPSLSEADEQMHQNPGWSVSYRSSYERRNSHDGWSGSWDNLVKLYERATR